MKKRENHEAGLVAYSLLFLYMLGWAFFMTTRISNIAGGADPTSYMELGRMISSGDFSAEMRQVGSLPLDTFDKGVYESIGLQSSPDEYTQRPTGFTGYPLLIAALDLILPESSAVWWSVFLGGFVAVLSIFVLMRTMGLSAYWALFAVGCFGLSPLVVKIGSLPMTDILSGVMAAWCWFCARKAHLAKRYAVLLGLGLGYAVLVRLTNVLFFIPILVTLIFNWRMQRLWWLVLLSGLPSACFLLAFNNEVYGSPFSNGYNAVEDLFGAKHFLPSVSYYGKTLLMLTLPSVLILFPFSLFYLGTKRRDVTVAWTWVVVVFGFHAFYYASYENWWILRYTLTAWTALLFGSTLVLSGFIERLKLERYFGWAEKSIAILLFALAVGYGAYQTKATKAYEFLFHEAPILKGVDWVTANTSERDVFLCFQSSGSLYYYTPNPIVRFERLSSENWGAIKTNALKDGYDIYAFMHLFEYDKADKLAEDFPGKWERVADAWPYGVFMLQSNSSTKSPGSD